MKFRLKRGHHEQGKGQERRRYTKGDIVESDIDLAARFGSEKFQRIEESAASSSPAATDFKQMKIAELKDYAEEEGIDLGEAKTKQQIVDILVAATSDSA